MARPRVTISMPVYKRPQRTQRAINCILNQTIQDYEAFVIGDGCPFFLPIVNDDRFVSFNTPRNYGGCGYWQTNYAIQNATSKYFIFYANDDVISPVHMATYLANIEGTDYDFIYYDYIAFGKLMKTKIKYARIGHSSLIVRTDFLKQMPLHAPIYGHDFTLIQNMIKAGAKYAKGEGIIPTYYVMSGNKKRGDLEGLD